MLIAKRIILFGFLFFSLIGCEKSDHTLQVSETLSADELYASKMSNTFIETEGTVEKLLPDDVKVPRHQKFIIKLNSGMTLMIAHNIDIAPRIQDMQVGDTVVVRGDYEWNEAGGVVHWTHHDPLMKRMGGWIKHKGKMYQ